MAFTYGHMTRCLKLFKTGSIVGRVFAEKMPIVPNSVYLAACMPELCRTRNDCHNHEDNKHMVFRQLQPLLVSSNVFSRVAQRVHMHSRQAFVNLASARGFRTSTIHCIMEDHQTKALTVWNNIRELRASPLPALSLGLAGLLPFIGAPAYMLLSSCYLPQLAFGQVVYGATILSFLGGVRWGFTIPEENPILPDWKNLGYSVVPPLVAWVGLMLPSPVSLFTVMGGLSAAAYFDMAMYGYPPWFKGLRFLLSFVAVLSLWTTFVCSLLMDVKKDPSVDKN